MPKFSALLFDKIEGLTFRTEIDATTLEDAKFELSSDLVQIVSIRELGKPRIIAKSEWLTMAQLKDKAAWQSAKELLQEQSALDEPITPKEAFELMRGKLG